jgi:dolichol-phosphate mannosyltransferase
MVARSGQLLVALATYNERDNLAPLVAAILHTLPHADLLITDDASPDGTGAVAAALAADSDRVRVIHRPGKLGLGTAYLGAMRHAIDRGYALLLTMDADSSHAPHHLPALIAGMDRHDVMIGSRYVPGGGVVNWPLSRRWMSRMTNFFVRVRLRLPARDTSSGYRCYRVEMLRRADLDGFLSRGYSFLQEVLQRCVRAGARVGETPIVFVDRAAGKSKAGLGEISRSLFVLLRLGCKTLWSRHGNPPERGTDRKAT